VGRGVAERIINAYYYVQVNGQIHSTTALLWREETPIPSAWESVWVRVLIWTVWRRRKYLEMLR